MKDKAQPASVPADVRDGAVCVDMYSAADVIDAMDKVKRDDEALMKRALRGLELYAEQTRPIHGMDEIIEALYKRLLSTADRATGAQP